MGQDDKAEYKYKEPLRTILMVIILVFLSGIGLFANLKIMSPNEHSVFFSLGEFERLGVFILIMVSLIFLVAKPLLRLVLAQRK